MGGIRLYDFQRAAIHGDDEWPGILASLRRYPSTLVSIFTGGGKTVIASSCIEMARRKGRKSLFVAHRGELLSQTERRLLEVTDVPRMEIGLEKAGTFAHDSHSVVLGSVASMRGDRLQRFDASQYGLVVVDECHHGAASTYRNLIDHFAAAGSKIMGLSATPWRLDGKPLDEIFVSTAYEYNLLDAIRDGRAVPVVAMEERGAVDLSSVHRLHRGKGDYDEGELAAVMSEEAVIIRTAKAAFEAFDGRQTIIFTAGLAQNEKLSQYMNAVRTGCAVTVDGSMKDDRRRWAFRRFSDNRAQYLINCQIATEGYDNPAVSGILMARPTQSLGLYVQKLGRGTRLLGTSLDESIANGKSDLLVVDMVGVTGEESSLTAVRALGSGFGERACKRAAKDADKEPVEVVVALEEAADRVTDEDRRRVVELTRVELTRSDPLGVLGIAPRLGGVGTPATRGQLERLARHGVRVAEKQLAADSLPEVWLSTEDAAEALSRLHLRFKRGLATPKMAGLLNKYGLPGDDALFDAARAAINQIEAAGWRPGKPLLRKIRKQLDNPSPPAVESEAVKA